MVSANQIREVVSRYVGDNDLQRFVLEFSSLSFNIHKCGSKEAIRLAGDIESKLARSTRGHSHISDLRTWLRDPRRLLDTH